MRAVLDKAKSDKRVLHLINTDAAGAIVVERVKVHPEELTLFIFEVDEVSFAARKQPVALLRIGLEYEIGGLDGTLDLVFAVLVLRPDHVTDLEWRIDGVTIECGLFCLRSLSHDAFDDFLNLALHLLLLRHDNILLFHFILI